MAGRSAPLQTPFLLRSGETVQGIDLTVTRLDDRPGWSTDAAGDPIAYGTVLALGTDGVTAMGAGTKADGSYEIIRGLPAGDYRVRATRFGFVPQYYTADGGTLVFDEAQILSVADDEIETGIDLALHTSSVDLMTQSLDWTHGTWSTVTAVVGTLQPIQGTEEHVQFTVDGSRLRKPAAGDRGRPDSCPVVPGPRSGRPSHRRALPGRPGQPGRYRGRPHRQERGQGHAESCRRVDR